MKTDNISVRRVSSVSENNFREYQNSHFMFSFFFLPENRAFCEMWKNI